MPKAVTGLVVEPAFGEVDLDVVGVPSRNPAALRRWRDRNGRRQALPARAAETGRPTLWLTGAVLRGLLVRIEDTVAHFLDEATSACAPSPCRRGTQRLRRGSACSSDGVGVVLAIVAALAAVLLRHRRHHAAAQRPALASVMRSSISMAGSSRARRRHRHRQPECRAGCADTRPTVAGFAPASSDSTRRRSH